MRVQQKLLDSLQLSSRSHDFHQDTVRSCEIWGLSDDSQQFQILQKYKKKTICLENFTCWLWMQNYKTEKVRNDDLISFGFHKGLTIKTMVKITQRYEQYFDHFKINFNHKFIYYSFFTIWKNKNMKWPWTVPSVLLSHSMIILSNHVKQRLWNRLRLFSPSFAKMDVTFETGHLINSVKVFLVANGISLPIKTTLWFSIFNFFVISPTRMYNFLFESVPCCIYEGGSKSPCKHLFSLHMGAFLQKWQCLLQIWTFFFRAL